MRDVRNCFLLFRTSLAGKLALLKNSSGSLIDFLGTVFSLNGVDLKKYKQQKAAAHSELGRYYDYMFRELLAHIFSIDPSV